MLGRNYGTNQNLIARPGNADIYPARCQHQPQPQTFNNVVASTQLEHTDEGRNFG